MDSNEPPSQSLLELKNILEDTCFFSFQFEDGPNTITKEQSLVVKEIEKLVGEDEAIATRIIEGLSEIFTRDVFLKKALLPSVLKKEGVTFVIEQESLVRILLKVSTLQDDVLKLLLEELVKVCSTTEDCSDLRLLLNPLKYLPNINDAKYFSQKLLDILEICTPELQLEMLDVIPDIIPDSCYNTVAEQLLTILNEENSPRDAIIECFGAFDFDDNVKEFMYDKLMNSIVPVHPQCLPAAIKLLFNTHKGKIPLELFSRIRNIVDCEMKKKDDIPLKSQIVNALKCIANKENFIHSCLDMINSIKTIREHTTFDLFILLILQDNNKCKEILRKKVDACLFSNKLVKDTILNIHYFETLAFHHNGTNLLIKFASFWLRLSSNKIENFTRNLFHTILSLNSKEEKFQNMTREIVECFIKACTNSDVKIVHQSLKILYRLVKKNPEKFYNSLNKLMSLLKRMDELDLNGASMVYKIICFFPHILGPKNPQSETIETEISIMVRKQLMSSKRLKKSKGIMGAIWLLQHDVILDNEESKEGSESTDEEEVPERILTLVESVNVLTEGFPECTGMFYDELALMVEGNQIKKNFVHWMTKKVRFSLEDYISSSREQLATINNLSYSPKFGTSLNGKCLTLKIGLMAAEPHKYVNKSLIILPPLFRLYRILIEKTYNDPMDSEDYKGFISSSFMLPNFEDIDELSTDQLKQSLDVLYHTINFVKEIVDATITEPIHENFFVDRFHQLIKLEGFFNDIITRINEHVFPLPHFYDCLKTKQIHEIKKKVTTKKAKKRKLDNDDTVASTSALNEMDTSTMSVQSKRVAVTKNHSKYLADHCIVFREINMFSLLNMIKFSTNVNEDEEEVKIGYSLLVFILRDVVKDLRVYLLKPIGKSETLFKSSPERVLESILDSLSKVTMSFNQLVKELRSSEVLDENCDIIMCFSYFLELFNIVLSVPVGETDQNLIDRVHQALDVDKKKSDDLEETRKILIRNFTDNLKISVILSHGVSIYQSIEKIMQYQQGVQNRNLKINLCETILWKQWHQIKNLPYSEKQLNQDTKFILEKYFTELKIQQLHELVTKIALEYAELKVKKDNLGCLPIIKFSNFHILFVCLCNALHENVEKEVHSHCSNMEHLRLWKNTTSLMFVLMGIAKDVNTRHNLLLCTFLKKSIPILKIFIAQALPIFDIMFSSKTEMVVDILKSMQSSTRFIHHLCCQSKMFKNFSVISHIPGFRLVLEQLIYKVKALLVSHKCEEAFFLGNLKNKDIHGNTQTSTFLEEDSTCENGENEDEEMVEDDCDASMEDDRSESLTF